ncbi:hypothetical protein S245_070462, partial [Arachis hypogaea]
MALNVPSQILWKIANQVILINTFEMSIKSPMNQNYREKATGVKPSLQEGEFKKRKTELSQVALSLDNEGDVEASKESLDIPDDYTVWNEVVTKGKKKAAF